MSRRVLMVSFHFPPAGGGAQAQLKRIADVIGTDFADNALAIAAEREGVRLDGRVSLPSYSRANALQQYAYVNGRPVRDKLIAQGFIGRPELDSDMADLERHLADPRVLVTSHMFFRLIGRVPA